MNTWPPTATSISPWIPSPIGVSQINNIGLPELVAKDSDDYIEIAKQLAADVERLADLRSTMRERVRNSPLMDAERFTRNLEVLFRKAVEAWPNRIQQ